MQVKIKNKPEERENAYILVPLFFLLFEQGILQIM